jgi:acetyltransferase-like isoleucine patch superfamily enzyme
MMAAGQAATANYDHGMEHRLEGAPAPAPLMIRGDPPPRRGGPLTLVRFMRAHRMLTARYLLLILRLGWLKLRHRGRLQTDGIAFVGPGVSLEIGRNARVVLGRWSWIGHGCKIRAHEGEVRIGAKTVLGQECTVSAYQRVAIGRECILADRVMLIDFDHGVVDVEQPIRLQGIYKRDVSVGNNVWIGYGACLLRGVSVGDNAVIGTNSVVTKSVPDNAVVGGVPARVLRMRAAPQTLRWE